MLHTEEATTPALARKARTRKTILDAAGTLFAANGIEGTSVEQVAELAEVSVGTLYFHFGNKETLALAFIESAIDVIERLMAETRRGETAMERVQLAGDAYLAFAIEYPVACRFGTVRSMQPELRGPHSVIGKGLRNRVQQMVMMIAGDLKQAMDDGEIRRESIADLMIFMWSSCNGMVSMMVRQDKLAIPPETARRSFDLGRSLLLESLRP